MRLVTIVVLVMGTIASPPFTGAARAATQVCVGAIRTHGLAEGTEKTTRRVIVEELVVLGAEIPTRAHAVELEASCFDDPGCVRDAVTDVGVVGVIDVSVIRVGPIVRLNIRFFDAANGIRIVQTESTAPARGFPDTVSFKSDLDRGLEALRRLNPPGEPTGTVSDATADTAAPSAEIPPTADPDPTAEEIPDRIVDVTMKPSQPAEDPGESAATAASAGDDVLSTVAWSALGVGGLLVTGGAGAGITNLVLWSQLEAGCDQSGSSGCPDELQGQRDWYYFTSYLAPSLLGVGVLAAGAGAAVLLLSPGRDEATEDPGSGSS